MPAMIRVALLMDLLLTCAEATIPTAGHYLPIAGNHFSQLGLELVVAVILIELGSLWPR